LNPAHPSAPARVHDAITTQAGTQGIFRPPNALFHHDGNVFHHDDTTSTTVTAFMASTLIDVRRASFVVLVASSW
jgi:hypothetical protein